MSENILKKPIDPTLYQSRLHWVIFIKSALVFLIGIIVEILWGNWLGLPLIGIAIVLGAIDFLNYLNSSIRITKDFITIQTGILVVQTRNVSRTQLESIDITQSIMGSFLNYGSLVVRGTGGTNAYFSPIADPLTCRRFIEMR